MRKDHERLLDIRDAIVKIQKYAERGRLAFENDELVQTWIIHHLQTVKAVIANEQKGPDQDATT